MNRSASACAWSTLGGRGPTWHAAFARGELRRARRHNNRTINVLEIYLFVVGLLQGWTGSYMAGFGVLGALSVLGGLSLLIYGYLKPPEILPAKAAA